MPKTLSTTEQYVFLILSLIGIGPMISLVVQINELNELYLIHKNPYYYPSLIVALFSAISCLVLINFLRKRAISNLIKENSISKDKLRSEVFENDFDVILSKHASSGFPILRGSANADITDLYRNELNIFADNLANIITEVSSKGNLRSTSILPTVKELLSGKAHKIKELYIVFIEKYFSSLQKAHQLQMKDSFSLCIDDATGSLIKQFEADIKLKEKT